SHYSATIDWGDFSGTSAGTITLSNGVFTVNGSHNYSGSGTFPINVTIAHEGAPPTFAQGQVSVSSNPVLVSSPGDQFATEGTLVSFTLGSFSDSTPNANSWRVDVNWGDNTAHTAFTTNTPGSLGNQLHTYGEEGVYPVVVTVTDNQNQTGSASFNVTAADLPVTASAANSTAFLNTAFSNQVVATFSDPAGAEPNANDPVAGINNHYSASIDWGDGSGAMPGTITFNNGAFTISGGHTYTQIGTFTTTVTINHETASPTVVTGMINVSSSPLLVTAPANQSAVEGASNNFSLGTFKDSTANASPWRVDVNWGDNTAHTTFTTSTQGSLGNRPHVYGEEGTYTVTITVTDNQNVTGSASYQVTVSDPPVLASATNFSASSNSAFTNQVVATFTDPGGAEPNASDPVPGINSHYSASIDWGDSSGVMPGTITFANGVFTVTGSHTYVSTGDFITTVFINHENAPQTTPQGSATVGTSAIVVTTAGNQTASEGASLLFNLGSFSDMTNATAWQVDVNWGDNTPHTTFNLNSQGTLGTSLHTYGEEGVYIVTETVTNNANMSAASTFQVSVSDPAVVGSAANFSASSNSAFTQPVATFTDPGGAEPNASDPNGGIASHYSATIDWGDFSGATPGTISFANGVFTVTGSHTYTGNGTFATTVTIVHEGAPQTVVQGSATVGTTNVAVSSPGNQTAVEGAITSINLGSFSDVTGNATSWSVDVNWGDGTADTIFTTGSQGALGSQVHTYGEEGTYTARVTVTDNQNQAGSATFQVTVTDPAVVGSAVNFSANANTSLTNQPVAVFTDPGGAEPNAADPIGTVSNHYTANINWGDNTAPTTGTITLSGNTFTIQGGHTYSSGGTFTTTITILHEGAPLTTLTGTASVSGTTTGLINFVNFETGDFSQTAAHQGGAIVTSPALDGHFSLQLFRSNSVAWAEIRQNGSTFYNLPTAFYSFQFQYASQTGEGGIVNFQDANGNYKAALHLSPSGKLLFYDANGNLLATGTTTLLPNQTYTISAKIGTGVNAPFQILVNGNVELSGTGNLGNGNNGSIRLGGNSAYTTNYYYDDVAIAANGFPGTTALTVTAPANQTATAGTASSFNLGSFSDTTSGANSWTVNVNWGDNTSPTTFTTTTPGSLGSQSHTYAQAGTYTATVTVTDNQNVSGSTTFQVTVSPSNIGLVNFVNFETGDFSQTAAHLNGAIVTSPALDGTFSLQLQRNNSVAWAEIRQNGSTFYNLPTAFYSFQFQYASQTGEGGIINFQDANGNYKAALHLSPSGKLLFYDANGNLLATGTTTLLPNQTYTISAKIGTGTNAPFEVRINGNVELSGTGNLGAGNNGSIRLGGNNAYTTNYYYDDVAIAANGYPGGNAPPPGGAATLVAGQHQAVAVGDPAGMVLAAANGSSSSDSLPLLTNQSSPQVVAEQESGMLHSIAHSDVMAQRTALDSVFADWANI
ncbi:MAG TPA: PKD domain-containing protein, partial [Gemmataceae bacterium]|nr:PKD domain-containing protein [Gemmataceae bacterium]